MALDAITKRRSVRRFKSTGIPDSEITKVLEAAIYAPSWKNMQGCQILVVKGGHKRSRVAEAIGSNPGAKAIATAPVLLAICVDPEESGSLPGRDYFMTDAGILMDHLMLQAAENGFGTVFIGLFDEEKVREILQVPRKYRIVALTPLGLPAKEPGERPRKSLDVLVHWELWGERS